MDVANAFGGEAWLSGATAALFGCYGASLFSILKCPDTRETLFARHEGLQRMRFGRAPLVTIKFDARGVGNAAQLAAREVYDIFAIAYPAVAKADLGNVAPLANQAVRMEMDVLGRSIAEERASVLRRLMAMCISDLSRGVRQTLEDAATYAELIRARPEMFRTDDVFLSEEELADRLLAAVAAI